MAVYIQIGDNINNDLLIEIPSEKDGTLLLSSVAAQYPGSVGLRFKSDTGAWRGCRVEGNVINAPADGWGSRSYYAVRQAPKRSAENESTTNGAPNEKQTREEDNDTASSHFHKSHVPDLMIADLPFSADDEEIKDYFETFGPLETFKIMKNDNGKSRGFGFIKYKTPKATKAALNEQHFIHNRQCELRFTRQSIQMLQMGYGVESMPNDNIPTKLFIGRLPIGTTSGELTEVFKKYGPLKDVYIPQHAKGYGFVTFGSVVKAFRAMSDTHMIKGQYINVLMSNGKQQKNSDGSDNKNNNNQTNNISNNKPLDEHLMNNGMMMRGNMGGSMGGNMFGGNMGGNMFGGNMYGDNQMRGKQSAQNQANSMAQVLLEGMQRMSEQARMNKAAEDLGTLNNTGYNYGTGTNGAGFGGAYGGSPGAGALAGTVFAQGAPWNNRGKH